LTKALEPYDGILKLVSYIIGPAIAVYSFLRNRRDRKELIAQARELGTLQAKAERAQKEAEEQSKVAMRQAGEARRLQAELKGITKGAEQLWKLRPARPFDTYEKWYPAREGAVLVTIGNLKGGVGKTTIAGNFAAYLSETLHRRVLLIDLDYQGSLSTMMLLPLQREEEASRVESLFAPTAGLSDLLQARIHLVPPNNDVPVRLSQGWIVPAGYAFSQVENQLLLAWLLNRDDQIDVRYRLSHSLLHPDVRRDYDVIIFDMPPRMTLGAINALVASHYFFVPTDLGKLSVEAIPQFLSNVKAIRSDLKLGIELAGIIGTLTRQDALSKAEQRYLEMAAEAGRLWEKTTDFVLPRTIPRRAAVSDAAGEEIAYLLNDATKRDGIHKVLNPLFEEMCRRIGLAV
jgi:chromosome partitioning protein